MKKVTLAFLLLVALVSGLVWLSGCGQNSDTAPAKEKQLYTCGMHPQVIQDHPGNCPICGMKLTPVRNQTGTNASAITIDPATLQNMNFRTAAVVRGPLRRSIRALALVQHSEGAVADVTTKFQG